MAGFNVRQLLRNFRQNFIVPLSLLWLLILLFVYLCPLLENERALFAEFYADQPLRLMLIIALIVGMRQISERAERRFWTYLTVAFAFWFIGDIAFQPPPDAEPTVAMGLVEDLMFLAFYPLFLIALEQRPHEGPMGGDRHSTGLLYTGIILFSTCCFTYFTLIEALLAPESYLSVAPSYTYFVVLDLLVTLRLFTLAFASRGRRWRVLYGLVGLAMAGWTFGDVLDMLTLKGLIEMPLGTFVDFIWIPSYYVMIGALWYRNGTLPRRSPGLAGTSIIQGGGCTGCGRLLLLYAAALPLAHVVIMAADWLSPEGTIHRGVLSLAAALALAALAAVQFRRDRIERDHDGTSVSVILSDAEMQESRKMEALGRLAGGVAHDFNNLLTALQGYGDLMKEADDRGEREELALELSKGIDKASDLTRQLLTFSRRHVLKTEPIDLNQVIGSLDEMVRRIIGEDVELQFNGAGDLWPVDGDQAQLTQVVINLVVNARQAMPEGGRLAIRTANVHIRTRRDLPDADVTMGDYVLLEVRDTGCGIEEDLHTRVFEPFYTGRRGSGGTGLGLATVYGIVKQAGGHINLVSEPDRGSTFSLLFPRSAGKARASVEVDRAPLDPPKGGETILFAEDEDSLRKVVSRYLVRHGYVVLEARNGREALEVAQAFGQSIELLITDVVMPEMGGETLAARLTELMPGIPILFISGYLDDDSLFDPGRTGWEFLQKPFTYEGLTTRVRSMLDARE